MFFQALDDKGRIFQKRYVNEYNQWIAEIGLLYTKEMIQDYWAKILRWNL